MRTFFNRTALKVTIGYIALIVILLVVSRRVSDGEGQIYDLVVIGFPWFLFIQNDSLWAIVLVVMLNALTVYAIIRLFAELFPSLRL
ncbi:MAG TPA: hypothetical protein VN881_06485 [Candidatus Acidoferrales bacterium]|jgi:hypothetical protein|nr:hypothetical protein [Candidatus Acidoferrales bacterium]